MASTDAAYPRLTSAAILAIFMVAIFWSAALLFAVQPMFTKIVLPRLGGSASVWSAAMVFFQTALLAGYAYAHGLIRLLPGRWSVAIHLTMMIAATLALPLHIAAGWDRPPASHEAFWLIAVYAVSIGLPVFALAANGPLLQAWFARVGHRGSEDPYFLYVASNVGSLLALLLYPTAIEPLIPLGWQTWLWSIGFYVLIALIGGCALFYLARGGSVALAEPGAASAAAPTWTEIGAWMLYAAVPAGLLLAVTVHISTDVAAVPLFWVVPLALYLLAFIIAFQARPLIPHDLVVKIFPFCILALAAVMTINPIQWVMTVIAVHTLAFFVVALMCHGELARRRPTPAYLTDFYMAISTGGMIGGIAVGLVSPQIFNWVAEYPLLIVLAILCLPQSGEQDRPVYRYALLAGLGALALGLIALKATGTTLHTSAISIANALLLALTVFFWRSRLSLAAIVAVLFAANYFWFDYTSSQYQARNFFGVLNVGETYDGRFRLLWHGTIAQGAERVRDNDGKPVSGRPELISEFFPGAGIAQVFDAVQARADGPIDYAVIGLGTGALTCRARPGDRAIYYEIDPDVIRIAQNPKLFRFISECGPNTPVIQGDARLSLADAPDGSYDLIFVDAFLGAAIPVHLLTREAMALYLRKLKPHGLVALHISNRNLELAPVIAGIAAANGAIARIYDGGDVEDEPSENKWVPKVAAVAREDADFGALAGSEYWPILAPSAGKRVWSDDYSNILDALLTNLRER